MGVEDTKDVATNFLDSGYIICHVPPYFSLNFAYGDISKMKVTFVPFCVKSFSC